MGGAIAIVLFVIGATWKVALFFTAFDGFKDETEKHFANIEGTLVANRLMLEDHGRTLETVRARQVVVMSESWTIQYMKDWAYQLDRLNRDMNAGKGMAVPDPAALSKKP